MRIFLYRVRYRLRDYLWDILFNSLLSSYIVPCIVRRFFINCFGGNVKGVIHGDCFIDSNKITIGKNSYLNRRCLIDNGGADIIIGNNVSIGFNVSFLTTNHKYSNPLKRAGKIQGKRIIIKDGCWIGANCIILPGTIINESCVVASGSIIKGELESNALYAGVPAIIKKRLNDKN